MFNEFQDYWKARKPALDAALSKAFSGVLGGIALSNGSVLSATLGSGKKIRGTLTCAITEALGGTLDAAIPRAVSVEMIQAATLIHDDFVDGDATRRGAPSAWTLEGARRAVLIGDVIFAFAIKMMSDAGKDDGASLSHAVAQVSRGALHEPMEALELASEIESGRIDHRFYENIIRLKTGILFGAACRLGAIAAGAGGKLRDACYRYGLRIGGAYQIADDLHDVNAYLSGRAVAPQKMAALAPALLRFTTGMRAQVVALLRSGTEKLDAAGIDFLGIARQAIEKEIVQRLRSAAAAVTGQFPSNGYTRLLERAPGDILQMFTAE